MRDSASRVQAFLKSAYPSESTRSNPPCKELDIPGKTRAFKGDKNLRYIQASADEYYAIDVKFPKNFDRRGATAICIDYYVGGQHVSRLVLDDSESFQKARLSTSDGILVPHGYDRYYKVEYYKFARAGSARTPALPSVPAVQYPLDQFDDEELSVGPRSPSPDPFSSRTSEYDDLEHNEELIRRSPERGPSPAAESDYAWPDATVRSLSTGIVPSSDYPGSDAESRSPSPEPMPSRRSGSIAPVQIKITITRGFLGAELPQLPCIPSFLAHDVGKMVYSGRSCINRSKAKPGTVIPSLKAVGTHVARFGEPVTFTFIYASREFLELEGIIPNPNVMNSPTPGTAKSAKKPVKMLPRYYKGKLSLKRRFYELNNCTDAEDDEEPLPAPRIKTELDDDDNDIEIVNTVTRSAATAGSKGWRTTAPQMPGKKDREKRKLMLRREEIQIERRLLELEDEEDE